MRTSKWMFTAALLVSVSAAAQQVVESQQPAPASHTQISPGPEASVAAPPATELAAAQPAEPQTAGQQAAAPQAAPSQPSAPAPTPSAMPQPVTMDQVVDRFIDREHALMTALSSRTPVVETYLQNLSAHAQLGPVPSDDHYFLGRMDMGETVDRKDYLKEKDQERSMQTRLMGGFNKLFKVQYQPLGFSWMVYADRTDFDRSHYDFHYVRREFLGDVRCLVFDVTPNRAAGKASFL